jgi:L-lactate dehydrogenase complex protein LldF
MLIELRRRGVTRRTAPWSERVVFKTLGWLLRHPALYRAAAPLARVAQRPFARDGVLRGLPFFFGRWTRTRVLPVVAPRTFTERWLELEREP